MPRPARILYAADPAFKYQRIPLAVCRADINGSATVRIADTPGEGEWEVAPLQAVKDLDTGPQGVTFKVTQPGCFVVRKSGGARLFLFLDPADAWPVPQDAVLASDAGIHPDRGDDQTDVINAALEKLSQAGGGILRLTEGLYPVTTVRMQSNVTLYLDEGAVVQASLDRDAYPEDPEGILYTELPKSLIPGPRKRVIYFDQCENAALVGRGIVSGQGSELRRRYTHTERGRPLINLMKLVHARNVRVEGVTLQDSEFWNTHVLLSQDVLFDRVKVVNEKPPRGWAVYLNPARKEEFWNNTDGINPDSSQRITIRNGFFCTGDDCVAVKNTGTYRNELRDVRDIHVHDNVIATGATPMKIGTETRGDVIEDVLFENNKVVTCSRPMAIEAKDGAVVRNITWRNLWIGDCNRPFDVEIMPRQDEPNQERWCRVEDILVDGVRIEMFGNEGANYECHVTGRDDVHQVKRAVFRDVFLDERPLSEAWEELVKVTPHTEAIQVREGLPGDCGEDG